MVEQPEILKHDADAAAQRGDGILGQGGDVMAELGDQAAGRLQRQEQQPQQRGLAGARGAGEELEGVRLDAKAEVAQDLGPEAIAQSDVLESDHALGSPQRSCWQGYPARRPRQRRFSRCAQRFTGLARHRQRRSRPARSARMVSGPLTVGC